MKLKIGSNDDLSLKVLNVQMCLGSADKSDYCLNPKFSYC